MRVTPPIWVDYGVQTWLRVVLVTVFAKTYLMIGMVRRDFLRAFH